MRKGLFYMTAYGSEEALQKVSDLINHRDVLNKKNPFVADKAPYLYIKETHPIGIPDDILGMFGFSVHSLNVQFDILYDHNVRLPIVIRNWRGLPQGSGDEPGEVYSVEDMSRDLGIVLDLSGWYADDGSCRGMRIIKGETEGFGITEYSDASHELTFNTFCGLEELQGMYLQEWITHSSTGAYVAGCVGFDSRAAILNTGMTIGNLNEPVLMACAYQNELPAEIRCYSMKMWNWTMGNDFCRDNSFQLATKRIMRPVFECRDFLTICSDMEMTFRMHSNNMFFRIYQDPEHPDVMFIGMQRLGVQPLPAVPVPVQNPNLPIQLLGNSDETEKIISAYWRNAKFPSNRG